MVVDLIVTTCINNVIVNNVFFFKLFTCMIQRNVVFVIVMRIVQLYIHNDNHGFLFIT